MNLNDYVKRKTHKPLSKEEKGIVTNIYKHVTTAHNGTQTDFINITAQISGLHRATVYRILHEKKFKKTLSSPKKSPGRTKIFINDDARCAIRRLVHSFFIRNEPPTLDKVLSALHEDLPPDIPKISRSKLWKTLKEINFKFKKRGRKSYLIERKDIVLWRRDYLKTIKKYRQEHKKIYYLDETWVNENHTPSKIWYDENIKSSRQAFLEGFSTGLKESFGKGRRLIVTHIGSDSGFVEGGLLFFESKSSKDYHEEMNSETFENWFKNILTKVEPNSVIVMDNAAYHSRLLEKLPTTAWRKQLIQDWLKSKNIHFDQNMIKAELLRITKIEKNKYKRYVVDEMAKAVGVTVLRLPPYHCELNPIEYIWAQLKGPIAKKNYSFKLADVKKLLLQTLQEITFREWEKCIAHVIKEEKKMFKLDGIIEVVLEPIIFEVNTGDSDFSDDPSFTDDDN